MKPLRVSPLLLQRLHQDTLQMVHIQLIRVFPGWTIAHFVYVPQEAAGALGNGPGVPGFGAGEDPMRECILLAACGAGELLPQNPELPADVFTACLTTPIKVPPDMLTISRCCT